jgi:GDSL-like Lipase/Acylhydrolase
MRKVINPFYTATMKASFFRRTAPLSLFLLVALLSNECANPFDNDRNQITETTDTKESLSKSSTRIWRILPLGDSITFDHYRGDKRPTGVRTGYRRPLWNALKSAEYNIEFVGNRKGGKDVRPAFDPDNAGFPGIGDHQLARLLKTGWNNHSKRAESEGPYLTDYPADIVLLHIGTNDLDADPDDVAAILDIIEGHEIATGRDVTVIIARIINLSCCTSSPPCDQCQTTTRFNNNIETMILKRIEKGDKLVIVDMECEAGFDYRLVSQGGDMFDLQHPVASGYHKMAKLWFVEIARVIESSSIRPSHR